MQGYGGQGMAQQITPEQYAQALQTYDALRKRQEGREAITQGGNPFAMLGAALGGALAGKFGKYKDTNMSDVEQQLLAYQEQSQAKIAAAAEAKAAEQARIKREQFLADKKADQDFEMAKKQFDVDNRVPNKPDKPSWQQQMYGMMTPEQQAAYLNNQAGIKQQGNQLFTPTEEALIQSGKVTQEQLMDKKANDAMGVKPAKEISGSAADKLGLLETAERDLLKYMDNAFVNGDYQEVGSKFGNTNDLFQSAVMNTLRAESGAAIGDQEIENFKDTYGASMFRSDETNMSKVQSLLEKIRTQKAAITGNQQTEPKRQPASGQLDMNTVNSVVDFYLKKQ